VSSAAATNACSSSCPRIVKKINALEPEMQKLSDER
jgi:preprotein translocase subunit SecA